MTIKNAQYVKHFFQPQKSPASFGNNFTVAYGTMIKSARKKIREFLPIVGVKESCYKSN